MKRGMWDDDNAEEGNRKLMTDIVKKSLKENPDTFVGCCGEDQTFLETYIWPLVKHTSMDHDNQRQRCINYGAAHCQDYPIGQTGHFVGKDHKDVSVHKAVRFTCNAEDV